MFLPVYMVMHNSELKSKYQLAVKVQEALTFYKKKILR